MERRKIFGRKMFGHRVFDAGAATAAMLALLLALSGQTSQARDLPGDVQRVKMIGFTVADVERQTDFFTKVLQFEKISDFRVVGGEYDQMQGVFQHQHADRPFETGRQTVES
jgi:hypothetical protein